MNKFAKGVERLVNPIDVGTIHFIQYFNNFLPRKINDKLVEKSGDKTPYMGFVVEPYSYYIVYEIKDLDKAKSFLPKGYTLAKTKIFAEDEEKFYGIFGCFNAHTSGFWGMRLEFYVIAECVETGNLSWIIVDHDTNTITYDPVHGLSDSNAEGSLLTIDYQGRVYGDIQNNVGRKLVFDSNIKNGLMRDLDKRLWVEGNISIAYSTKGTDKELGGFSLTFNPKQFGEGLDIPLRDINIEENNWFPGLLENTPSKLVCFPYAQHMLSDSPGQGSHIDSIKDLEEAYNHIDFSKINVFSTKAFKRSFLIGGIISALSQILVIRHILKKKKK